jgi:hypothetical protein
VASHFDGVKTVRTPIGTGSTGKTHPFRGKSERQVRRADLKTQEARTLTVDELMRFGIPVGLESLEGDQGDLRGIQRFEDDQGLSRLGVDRVMDRFVRAFDSGDLDD